MLSCLIQAERSPRYITAVVALITISTSPIVVPISASCNQVNLSKAFALVAAARPACRMEHTLTDKTGLLRVDLDLKYNIGLEQRGVIFRDEGSMGRY